MGPTLRDLLEDNSDDMVFVQCLISDPPYSTSWGESRYGFYNGEFIPFIWFDGLLNSTGASSLAFYQSRLNSRLAIPTDVTIGLEVNELSANSVEVTATVCLEAGGTAKTVRIYMAELLDNWTAVTSYARMTFRSAAATQDVALTPGNCEQVVRTFTFDSTAMAKKLDIRVACWAQDVATTGPAEVWQAEVTSVFEDEAAPLPDPAAFDVTPTGYLTPAFLLMSAQPCTDDSPPVRYQFLFVEGGADGSDSLWQTDRVFILGGLTPNTSYTYKVWARDSADPPHYTGESAPATGWTMCYAPGAPTLSGETGSTIDVDIDPSFNPAHTDFAIQVSSSDPVWDGKWVDAVGDPSDVEVYRTLADWGTMTVGGLLAETQYCFGVQAINGDGSHVTNQASACATTTAAASALIAAGESCRLHGALSICLSLDVTNVEPRQGGVSQLAFTMDSSVASVDATATCVDSGDYSGTVTVEVVTDTRVEVSFDPALPDQDCCTVTLSGDSEDSYQVRPLVGDIDRGGTVLGSDMLGVKPYIGQAAGPANAFADVDTNGDVLGSDMLGVKPFIGNSSATCP